ncbi:Pre-mRNA-splicing factor Cwf15/Cwc15 [Gracilaria domingensis]|nr:Pre-mRNA-splicing factor Cwf15/Cwc15 [Gracilaria domingensis]
MTTAHRATWKAARGGLQEEGSFQLHAPSAAVSGKDAPTERNLKKRYFTPAEASRDEMRLRVEHEAEHAGKRPRRSRFGPKPQPHDITNDGDDDAVRKLLPPPEEAEEKPGGAKEIEKRAEDGDECGADGDAGAASAPTEREPDRVCEEKEGEDPEDSEDEDDESDEDEAELLAELERIRKEREFERAKKQAEEQERIEREETSKAASENPLLPNLANFNDEISETASIATGSVPAFAVRRRWDDDVVFRDQARGERRQRPRFVNDTIRNDFHRRFMRQYMR